MVKEQQPLHVIGRVTAPAVKESSLQYGMGMRVIESGVRGTSHGTRASDGKLCCNAPDWCRIAEM